MFFCLAYHQHQASIKSKRILVNIRNLKQVLNHQLFLRKFHGAIKFNQNACLRPYIDITTDMRGDKAKKYFEKDFFKVINTFSKSSSWKNYGKREEA